MAYHPPNKGERLDEIIQLANNGTDVMNRCVQVSARLESHVKIEERVALFEFVAIVRAAYISSDTGVEDYPENIAAYEAWVTAWATLLNELDARDKRIAHVNTALEDAHADGAEFGVSYE